MSISVCFKPSGYVHRICRKRHMVKNKVITQIYRMDYIRVVHRVRPDRAAGNKYSSFIIKPTRCTNSPNLFRHETLYVSGNSSAHHQEFFHCTLSSDICHTGL